MIANLIFIALIVLITSSAVMAVGFKSVLYNAFSLMLTLMGIAAIFIFLRSEFLAVMEILIYVGAIAVAIIFAIMFSPPLFLKQPKRSPIKIIRSITISALLFLVLSKAIMTTEWIIPEVDLQADYSIANIGETMLHRYVLPFEIFSLIILLAMLGALMIVRKREINDESN